MRETDYAASDSVGASLMGIGLANIVTSHSAHSYRFIKAVIGGQANNLSWFFWVSLIVNA